MYEARPIDILPGIFKEASGYASQNRWVHGSNVRFWKGFPERIGGATLYCQARMLRPPRGMFAWQSLNGSRLVAGGHAYGVEVIESDVMTDVSPIGTSGYARLTVSVGSVSGGPYQTNETVTTANGATGSLTQGSASSPLYVSNHNGTHKLALTGMSGTFITGETVTGSGGGEGRVIIGGAASPIYIYAYEATFSGTITGATSSATGTYSALTELWTGTLTGGTSGATSTISAIGDTNNIDSGTQALWGDDEFGSGVWGGAGGVFGTSIHASTWTFAGWGEDLVGCPRGGNVYVLDTSAFLADKATNMTLITNAPTSSLGVFMSEENRTLVVYGAGGDPLNLAWCDEEDYTTWTPATSNTAGSIRCEDGSLIVGRMSARDGHLISTDTAIYLFRYTGLPFVFSLTRLTRGSGMIGPHASAELYGSTYWMGVDGFYTYNGAVQPLVCDVHQYVFGRLNKAQAHKICCGALNKYNEIWWFYVSDESSTHEIDSYVAYNVVEQSWHIGTKARTSWTDINAAVGAPVGIDANGRVWGEEYGLTEGGTAIPYTLETHDIEIGDGTTFLRNRKLIPDYERLDGTHSVSIDAKGWPRRTSVVNGPFSISETTEHISVRARGRTLRFSFAGSDDFRMGRWRYRITGDGAQE